MKEVTVTLTLDERDDVVACISDIVFKYEALRGYWLSDDEKKNLDKLAMKIAKA